MYGFKPGAKPQEKAPQGKKIEGPGNGTSDSIKTDIPKGSYIMPADSTQQIGPKTLGDLGQPVPVNVSNGEYQMLPARRQRLPNIVANNTAVFPNLSLGTLPWTP